MNSHSAEPGRGTWPVLLLLVTAVAVPTACVLWFMSEAVRNQRLAMRQKLRDAYLAHMDAAAREVNAYWSSTVAALTAAEQAGSAAHAFVHLVTTGGCDGAVIRRPFGTAAESARSYPANSRPAFATNGAGAKEPEEAAVDREARLLQGQARDLVIAGSKEKAVAVLAVQLADAKYRESRDVQGRLIAPSAELLALELMAGASAPLYRQTLDSLTKRLTDYGEPAMPFSQRRFLMHRLSEVVTDCPAFPTLAAEDLAAEYLETRAALPPPLQLLPSPLPRVWQMASADGTVIALFRERNLLDKLNARIRLKSAIPNASVALLPPQKGPRTHEPFLTAPAGAYLPGWQLALYFDGADPFAGAAGHEITVYLWTALLVVGATAAIALVVGRYMLRQMRLTRLKNGLIATVSHELKTPLSSMRVLVDTLLDGRCAGPQQEREYLQLIAGENQRLTRLIDNFLNFSRMERNRRAFEFAEIKPDEVVRAAAESFHERFSAPGCKLDLDIARDLPPIIADRDAVMTVLLNLLDNAWKYSGAEKRVSVAAHATDGELVLTVKDNGIGLTNRQTRRIFEPFYQVDLSLSRRAGGCGLGLSIVRFIVRGHGGQVEVASEPGKGSAFTVRLPVNGPSEETRLS